ncbi:MAG: hypothetical protein AB7U23_16415 [Dehalococcoidia bacterium]
MNFSWEDVLNEIFGASLVCPRCSHEQPVLVAGFSRKPELNRFAARHGRCSHGDECDARKLITLCVECALLEQLRGEPHDGGQLIEIYLLDCRTELDDSANFLTEYWRDDPGLTDEQIDGTLEDANPDLFAEEERVRRQLEQEYLGYHRELRARHRRIPNPGWRSSYVEDIRELGYETALGD